MNCCRGGQDPEKIGIMKEANDEVDPEEHMKLLKARNLQRKDKAEKNSQHQGEDNHPDELRAGMLPHRCTDCFCLLLFIASLVGFGYVSLYSYQNKDLRKLYYGFDFLGFMCGGENRTDEPFLYYCEKDGDEGTSIPIPDAQSLALGAVAGANNMSLPPIAKLPKLDLAHPICVAACPTTADTETRCFKSQRSSIKTTDSGTGSFDQIFHYEFHMVKDYPAMALGGHYCVPKSPEMADYLRKKVTGGGPQDQIMSIAKDIANAWVAVLCCVGIGILCGYLYLWSLQYSVGVAVYTCLAVPFVVFTLGGCNLILVSQGLLNWDGIIKKVTGAAAEQDYDIPEYDYAKFSSTGNPKFDLGLGIGLTVAGLIFGIVICCGRKSIMVAIGCLQASVECLQQFPSMLVAPLINVASQVIVIGFMLVGFTWLVSTGEVKAKSLAEYTIYPGPEVQGLMRTFEYEDYQYGFLFFYVFMMFWVYDVFVAMAQFTIIYATELWYFTPYVGSSKSPLPLCPLVKGFRIGTMYHLGSIAFGAFLVAAVRMIRLVAEIMRMNDEQEENEDGSISSKNAVCGCCQCCLGCCQKILEFVNKSVYMGVAMHSTNYCAAAMEAVEVLTKSMLAVSILNGVTAVLQYAGLGTCAAVGYGSAYLLLTKVPYFTNAESEAHVSNPMPLCIIGAIVSAAVSWVFLLVVDTVSDTILYCYVVDQDANKDSRQYAPEDLRSLINQHSAPAKTTRS